MRPPTDQQLMRLLMGELPADERADLEAAMREDADLDRRYRQLEHAWRALDAPAEPAADDGLDLASAVLARARQERFSKTPAWGQLSSAWRLATLVATAAGIAAGVWLQPPPHSAGELEPFAAQPSLAASYLAAFEAALEQIDESSGADSEEQP